jgi:parvulin-like peptidyl-prolyl isomerase
MQEPFRRRLLTERANESADAQAAELAERITREGLVSREAFEQLADADPTFTFQSTAPFGRSDNVAGIGRSTPFSAAAFELQEGTTSPPVRVGSDWAILRLGEVEEPRLPELAEVESEVRARLRELRAERDARDGLSAARERVTAGTTLDEIATELQVTVEETEEFASGGMVGALGPNAEVSSAALALEQGDVGEPVVAGSNIILYQVTERKHFDPQEFASNQEATRAQLADQKLDQLMASLVAERREELNVQYDPNLVTNLGLDQG